MLIPQNYYRNDVVFLAKDLIGKKLVRQIGKHTLSGIIVETEAYDGSDDSACHAAKGRTKRTEIMYGEAGHAYIYFIYGMHYMFNIVVGDVDYPAAILIRAIEPCDGIDIMLKNRKQQKQNLCNGPARLCQALNINRQLNGVSLFEKKEIWLEELPTQEKFNVTSSKRIGIDYANKKDREAKWRFYLKDNPHISKS